MLKTVAFQTLGCKVNQYDTDTVRRQFEERGYALVDFSAPADVYVINTCTVTNISDKKSRQMIRRAHRTNPRGRIVVMGCFSQMSPDEAAALPGVRLVLGTKDRGKVVDFLEALDDGPAVCHVDDRAARWDFEDLPAAEPAGRTRAYLKVQDGCSQFCTYCRVPYARGPSRSREPVRVLEQVEMLTAQGYKEIVLTGVHLGTYGRDLSAPWDLGGLVEAVCCQADVRRLRLSSIEPNEVTDRLLSLIADEPKVCRHLHVPLQSGSDSVLKSMGRTYDTDFFRQAIRQARSMVDGLAVTSDLIVGFPGERDEDFRSTLDFAEEMEFSQLHVFRFSPRSGTPAADMPHHVANDVKEFRSHRLMEVAQRTARRFRETLVGKAAEVLIEESDASGGTGFTDNYVRTQVAGERLAVGDVYSVNITGANAEKLEGIL